MQVVGNGRDFSLRKRMLSLLMGSRIGRLFFLRILNQDQNFDLPNSNTSYLK